MNILSVSKNNNIPERTEIVVQGNKFTLHEGQNGYWAMWREDGTLNTIWNVTTRRNYKSVLYDALLFLFQHYM